VSVLFSVQTFLLRLVGQAACLLSASAGAKGMILSEEKSCIAAMDILRVLQERSETDFVAVAHKQAYRTLEVHTHPSHAHQVPSK
jgi:hypothetical protein